MAAAARTNSYLRGVEAPAAIRDLPAWVIWRFEADPGGGKPRKVPYYADGGKRHGEQGGPKDLAGLVTFDAAKAAAARRGFDGVGFAPLPQFGICALDFDNCISGGKIHPQVEALLLDTYAEFSPSGQGIRLFFKGNLGNGKALRGGDFGMECFSTKGFVTFTGNVLDITELLGNTDVVAPLSDAVLSLHAERFARKSDADLLEAERLGGGEPAGLTVAQIQRCLEYLDPDCGYDDWLEAGMAVHCETGGSDEGLNLWDAWSSGGAKYPGRDVLEDKWRSFGRGGGNWVTGRTLVHVANEHGAGISLNAPASPEEFERLIDEVQEAGGTDNPLRYVFEPVHTFSSATALPWIIKGVLPKAALGVVYGASGSGKSFLVLDMGMAIARGVEWRGRKVKQGRVAYIAAEGADGFRKRLAAYALHHKVDLATVPMTVLNAAPNLMEKQDAVDVVKGIRASGGADLIVVDTFAQTTPGANENAAEDVGKALGYCKRIHEATGAMVLLIHHAGKDATKGARGWSGLRAAADAEIEVVREDTCRFLRLTKNKDGEDGLEWAFDLEVVQLGVDEDLEPITSCVVVEAQMPAVGAGPTRRLGKNEKVVNEVLQEIAQVQTSGIEIKAVLDEAVLRMKARDGVQGDKKGNYRNNARRALLGLCEGDDAPYWIDPEANTIEVM
jgi:hypothetical protein